VANLNGLLGAGNYFAYAASYSHDYSKSVRSRFSAAVLDSRIRSCCQFETHLRCAVKSVTESIAPRRSNDLIQADSMFEAVGLEQGLCTCTLHWRNPAGNPHGAPIAIARTKLLLRHRQRSRWIQHDPRSQLLTVRPRKAQWGAPRSS